MHWKNIMITLCLSLLVDISILANLSQVESLDSSKTKRQPYMEYIQRQEQEQVSNEKIEELESQLASNNEKIEELESQLASNNENKEIEEPKSQVSSNAVEEPKNDNAYSRYAPNTYSYNNPWNTVNDNWHTNGNRNLVVELLSQMSSSEYRQRAISVNARDVLNHVSYYYGEVLKISGTVYNTDWYAANTETFFPNRSACQEINIVSEDGTAVALYIENGNLDVSIGDEVNLYGMTIGTQAQTSKGPAVILMGKPIIDQFSQSVQSYSTYNDYNWNTSNDTYNDDSWNTSDNTYTYDAWNTANDDWHTNGNRYGVIDMLSYMSDSEYRQRAISVDTTYVLNNVSAYYGEVLKISGRIYNTDSYAANTETFFPNQSACQEINIVSDNGTAVALYIENGNLNVEVGEYVTLYGMAIGTQAETSKGPAIILMGKPIIDRY